MLKVWNGWSGCNSARLKSLDNNSAPTYDGLSFEKISSEAVLNWVYFRNCEFFVDADLKVP